METIQMIHFVSGGAKVEEKRRFENPVVAARKSCSSEPEFHGVTWSFIL
jgi:hypothetical protein